MVTDGTELFYRNGEHLMVVSIDAGEAFTAGAPTQLFDNRFVLDNAAGGGGNPNYDMSPAGDQFVFVEDLSASSGAAAPQLQVVLNWHQELLERVPIP